MNRYCFESLYLSLGIAWTLSSIALSQDATLNDLFMCAPTEIVCSDDFESDSVADRWGFRAFFEVEDGILKRTSYEATESARAFLKDVVYRDVIIKFDVRFDGATDIRLVTGGGGGYNTVTQLLPKYFQVNTAKRKTEFNPSHQGECAFEFKRGIWHTITIEFLGNEVVTHVDNNHFVIGNHPIIDTERTYLAFQVSGGAASFDNFCMWKAKPGSNWRVEREKLQAVQARRGPAFKRDAKEEYDLIYKNLKDRLSLTDSEYRRIVAVHANANERMKKEFPSANQSRKEIGKRISAAKKKLKEEKPRFKEMEQIFYRCQRAIKNYVHSKFPELDVIPKQAYYFRYEECLSELADDANLVRLVYLAAQAEKGLQVSFPEAFQDIDALVNERNLSQSRMRANDEYRLIKNEIAEANRAIEAYLFQQEPRLAELSEARLAIIRSKK